MCHPPKVKCGLAYASTLPVSMLSKKSQNILHTLKYKQQYITKHILWKNIDVAEIVILQHKLQKCIAMLSKKSQHIYCGYLLQR